MARPTGGPRPRGSEGRLRAQARAKVLYAVRKDGPNGSRAGREKRWSAEFVEGNWYDRRSESVKSGCGESRASAMADSVAPVNEVWAAVGKVALLVALRVRH